MNPGALTRLATLSRDAEEDISVPAFHSLCIE